MLLDPHVGLIIWTIITFLVVLLVLKKFAWPHLLAALDEREKRISDAITAAEQARQEAEEVLREHRQKLAAADEEARQVVAEAREAGANVRQTIVSQAREVFRGPVRAFVVRPEGVLDELDPDPGPSRSAPRGEAYPDSGCSPSGHPQSGRRPR